MFVHIARQPIFNKQKRVFAYELLFRQTLGLTLEQISGDRATTSLLSSAFLTEGLETISESRPCFINFTKNLLLQEVARSFPKNKVIVEILEDVPPTPEILDACRQLAEDGYTLALDDFIFQKSLLPLIELVQIIKFDFQLSTAEEIERTMYRLSHFKLQYLAEKIETYQEFEYAAKLGCDYFQGYFFAKPESLQITEVESVKTNLIHLLAEVNKRHITVNRLEEIIEKDVALSYKLLRYINSSMFYLLKKVDSIHQAIIYLGEREIRKFTTLVIISELATDKPSELIRLSLIRARFCELLGEQTQGPPGMEPSDLFLLGLFSLIDALLDTPMQTMMERLPLDEAIQEALIHREGPLAPYLQVMLSYEQGNKEACLQALGAIRCEAARVYPLYLDAIRFARILD